MSRHLAKAFAAFLLMQLFLFSTASAQSVALWLTNKEETALLSKQPTFNFIPAVNTAIPVVEVNAEEKFQTIDGFGFALTGGSAQHLLKMSAAARTKLLSELFGNGERCIGISYLRLSIGASDLNDHVFSYNDLKKGETDLQLKKFNLNVDTVEVIPVLKEILAINPKIKIMASPWSAPTWMKTNDNIQGGKLKEEYYGVYANYFLKYIQQMKKAGITIDAITLQNEPFNNGNTPSMQMFAKEQLRFIKNHLGPLFKAERIHTKIILYDHNCDAPEYPISILTDPAAAKYIDGSGFHLYTGQTSAMSKVHDAFPQKNLYFTEMMAVSRNGFNVATPVDRILIGATRNWSKNVILWNLAANAKYEPHTDNGGCSICQGAITIEQDQVIRNTAYYVIGHASKFALPGSVRIASSQFGDIGTVAFETPAHKIVLIAANKGQMAQRFNILYKGKTVAVNLTAGAVATYVW
ncbi:glycoside hydrolase family 30 protein [Pedobacter duraquae]|uniref:Glucosylceramidase n=1 Tax=Pedobacter duraquae TaxID=425511 RepID=A0A4R6IPZ8_9SPHI|nr:glycoside hydrolase family 30 beta sandwich domain-containing protein [Pedobacter duraquae]TDO24251.1 glucosylceramidase [Pedobacter duraquae]